MGRSADADWSIPDPERILSKAHCRIEKDFNGFVLTDTSTNGVRINDEAVGFGQPRTLASGDVIKLGDAVVIAAIDDAPSFPANGTDTAGAGNGATGGEVLDGPFGGDDDVIAGPSQPGSGNPEPAPAESAAPVLDDWWQPDVGTAQGSMTKPVDIPPREGKGAARNSHTGEDSVRSHNGAVASLLRMGGNSDLNTFARAVESAALILSEDERQKFNDRLLALLRESSPHGN
ncbi:FHA domain-containing protein [Nitratireductor sp. GCM10026969]|uniref:FHA domain-containing protein n=1 Tax=Nitratireductor sp. GCM10026969 TaxID=3252645 RepID=UPI00361D424B